jgi:excinuclease ABC subunit A
VTEVADYARLLWALCGEQRCPKDGGRVQKRSLDDCIAQLFRDAPGERAMFLAPFMCAKPSVLREELPRLRQRGFQRVRIGGEIKSLEEPRLVPNGAAEIPVEVVVDRLVLNADQRSRVADSLELAFREGQSRALVLVQRSADAPWREIALSQNLSCEICGDVFEPLTPRHFSFNNKEGACPDCGGLGRKLTFSDELVIPDPEKSVREGAIKPWRIGGKNLIIKHNALLKQLAEQLPFDPDVPWKKLPEETRRTILHGAGERLFSFKLRRMREAKAMPFAGVVDDLMTSFRETDSEGFRARLTTFMISGVCPTCGGSRLNPRSNAVFVGPVPDRPVGSDAANSPRESLRTGPVADRPYLGYAEFTALDITRALEFLRAVSPGLIAQHEAAEEVVAGVEQRLHFLDETGLGYLTLDREYSTLSGGESQRVRLATQLGMGLVGVIYVLDEPSIGLHPRDNLKLLATLRDLRDRGNTVIVVEHDEDTMRIADQLIELGPGAGREGGDLLFQGTPEECMRLPASASRTGPYLARRMGVVKDAKTLAPDGRWLVVRGAAEHNLQNIDTSFPVGLLTCVTGVSGSGKSSLVNDILAAATARKLNGAKTLPGKHKGLSGLEHFEKTVQVTQEPIGRSPRSNPATYVGLLDLLRDLFAQVPLAKVRGYKASRFSFNVRGGRCERCQGDGQIRLDMQFMADAFAPCPSCDGRRFNRETLEVRFHGKNIADVLDLTVREAMELFRAIPRISEKLATLDAVGLGYLQLGQSATTLSGGEAQRLKLSLELSKREQGRTLYILDEPTTGLHWADIQRLMELLFKLRDAGNTIVVIEHNLDVINLADWIIDLGPGGGPAGGAIVYAGARQGIEKVGASPTGAALAAWRRA